MKKIMIIFIIAISISLLSCEPEQYYFKNNPRIDKVVKVELISYTSNKIEVIDSTDNMLDIIFDNMEILKTLDESEITSFVADFSNIEFFLGYDHLNSSNGIGIRLIFDNEDFLVVIKTVYINNLYGEANLYSSSGHFIKHFGGYSWPESFEDLVYKYFDYSI